jgi:carboxylesterase type B
MPWGPAIDGSKYGLLDTPLNLLKAGQFNKVPTIFGTNANEGSIFVPMILVMIPGTTFPPTQDNIQQGCGVLPSLYSCAVAVIVCL